MLYKSLAFIGQKLTVGRTYTFLLPGRPKTIDLAVTGVFQTGDELSDTTVSGFASLARQIARLPAGDYSSLNVSVARPEEIAPVKTAIAGAGSKPPVQVPESLLNPLEAGMKTSERFLLTVVTALGLFISIIMSITVLERRKEFAVLKAVGGRHITTLVLIESLILGAAGALVGVWPWATGGPYWPISKRPVGFSLTEQFYWPFQFYAPNCQNPGSVIK